MLLSSFWFSYFKSSCLHNEIASFTQFLVLTPCKSTGLARWGGELKLVAVWSFVVCSDCWYHTLTNLEGEKQILSCCIGAHLCFKAPAVAPDLPYVKLTDFWGIILAQGILRPNYRNGIGALSPTPWKNPVITIKAATVRTYCKVAELLCHECNTETFASSSDTFCQSILDASLPRSQI